MSSSVYLTREDPNWDIFERAAAARNGNRLYTGSSWSAKTVAASLCQNGLIDLRSELEDLHELTCFVCSKSLEVSEGVHQKNNICLPVFFECKQGFLLGAIVGVCAAPNCPYKRYKQTAHRYCTNLCLSLHLLKPVTGVSSPESATGASSSGQ